MKLLILGGTGDARRVTEKLHYQSVPVVYSVAGLVRTPDLGCPVVVGGFRQFGGLTEFITENRITAILDMTHPYAVIISDTAMKAAKETGIYYWQFQRAMWEQSLDDKWQKFSDWQGMINSLANKQNLFVTVGQVSESLIFDISVGRKKIILRTAVKPKIALPENVTWLEAIGPFNELEEITIMKYHRIDALITKDSGGEATSAKLTAARKLGLDVFMLARPIQPKADLVLHSIEQCEKFVLEEFKITNSPSPQSLINAL